MTVCIVAFRFSGMTIVEKEILGTDTTAVGWDDQVPTFSPSGKCFEQGDVALTICGVELGLASVAVVEE